MKSKTPLTDKALDNQIATSAIVLNLDFVRKLERKLIKVTKERDGLLGDIGIGHDCACCCNWCEKKKVKKVKNEK